jgi:hypothetical protein
MRIPLDEHADGRWRELLCGRGYRYLHADVDVRQWDVQENLLL